MKITCNTEQLKKYTGIALRCVSKQNTLPILNALRLRVEGKFLVIESTNLSLGVSCKFPVQVEEEGELVVKSGVFDSVLSNIKDKNITFIYDKGNLKIKTDSNEMTVKGEDKEEFPNLPKVESSENVVLKSSIVAEGIKSVVWATANSDIKPELSSVYIYNQNENLVFVATDSFRLAERKIKTKKDIPNIHTLIPFKNATEISKILEVLEDDVNIYFSKNQISFVTSNIYLTSRVVDSVFPDYKQIIPKDKNTEIIFLKKDFIDVLRIAQVFSDKFNHLSVSINKENKECLFVSKNGDVGEQVSKIKTTISGDSVSVNVNLRYIMDALSVINEDSLSMSIVNPTKPITLTGVGNNEFLYLLMPMNR